MLNFEREDEWLRQAVGADARTILSASEPQRADLFELAQARMQEMFEDEPAPAKLVERDRLADFFHCAYGEEGLLTRAGALLTLKTRLARLAVLTPHLVEDARGLERVQREAVIVRTFARERLSRPPNRRESLDLFDAVSAAARVTIAYADFVSAAATIDADKGGYLGCRALWATAELSYIAAEEAPIRPLFTVLGFAAARLADHLAAGASGSGFDALCEAHYSSLRRELWEAFESQFARSGGPAPLTAIERADYDLESLFGALRDSRLKSATRARALGDLYALVSSMRASQAAQQANRAFEGAVQLIGEGLADEERGASR